MYSSMNSFPVNKSMFTISFIFYLSNKISPNRVILLKGAFNPMLLNNSLAFCSLTNINFSLSHTLHFDESIISLFALSSRLLGFYFWCFFYT